MRISHDKSYMTLKEINEQFNIPIYSLWYYQRTKRLKYYKVGKQVRVKIEDLEEFFRNCGV